MDINGLSPLLGVWGYSSAGSRGRAPVRGIWGAKPPRSRKLFAAEVADLPDTKVFFGGNKIFGGEYSPLRMPRINTGCLFYCVYDCLLTHIQSFTCSSYHQGCRSQSFQVLSSYGLEFYSTKYYAIIISRLLQTQSQNLSLFSPLLVMFPTLPPVSYTHLTLPTIYSV